MPSLSYFGGQLFKAPSTAIILRLKNSEVAQNHHSLPLHNLLTLPSGGVGTGISVFLRILGKSWTWVRTEIFSPAIRKTLKCINVFPFFWWLTTFVYTSANAFKASLITGMSWFPFIWWHGLASLSFSQEKFILPCLRGWASACNHFFKSHGISGPTIGLLTFLEETTINTWVWSRDRGGGGNRIWKGWGCSSPRLRV